MKFLKDEIIEEEADGVKITLHPVTTSMQSALLDLAGKFTVEGQIGFAAYGLNNIISTLEINGTPFNPKDVAKRADLHDKDTVNAMVTIGRLLDKACFVDDEQKKSSSTSVEPSRPGSGAENAQDRMAVNDQ